MVVFEETFARGNAKFRLDSLQTITMLWAVLNRLRWMRVAPSVIKLRATGIHNASKQQVWLEAAHRWKDLEIWSYDQADALWALDYALQGDGDKALELET
jgi:Holliday junction resolvasome RuvABC endonuclease subunit